MTDYMEARYPLGYLYVTEYWGADRAVLKVGVSKKPLQRLATLNGEAKKKHLVQASFWASEPHENYLRNERALLAWCRDRAPQAEDMSGSEWSVANSECNFYHAVEYAKTLSPDHPFPEITGTGMVAALALVIRAHLTRRGLPAGALKKMGMSDWRQIEYLAGTRALSVPDLTLIAGAFGLTGSALLAEAESQLAEQRVSA